MGENSLFRWNLESATILANWTKKHRRANAAIQEKQFKFLRMDTTLDLRIEQWAVTWSSSAFFPPTWEAGASSSPFLPITRILFPARCLDDLSHAVVPTFSFLESQNSFTVKPTWNLESFRSTNLYWQFIVSKIVAAQPHTNILRFPWCDRRYFHVVFFSTSCSSQVRQQSKDYKNQTNGNAEIQWQQLGRDTNHPMILSMERLR